MDVECREVVADYQPDPESAMVERERAELVRSLIGRLNPREQRVLGLRFTDGMVLREIGRDLGVSGDRANQILQVALRKIEKSLQVYGNLAAEALVDPPVQKLTVKPTGWSESLRLRVASKIKRWAVASDVRAERMGDAWRVRWMTLCRRRSGPIDVIFGDSVPFEWKLDPCADSDSVLALVDSWVEAVNTGPLKELVLPVNHHRPARVGWRSGVGWTG